LETVYYLSEMNPSALRPLITAAPSPDAALRASPEPATPAPSKSPPGISPAVSAAAFKPAGYHQAGVFSKKANADALIARLKQSGFGALQREAKNANGDIRYYVIVPFDGTDKPSYVDLKEAGFETVPFRD
jgi:cell division septation protein DedD